MSAKRRGVTIWAMGGLGLFLVTPTLVVLDYMMRYTRTQTQAVDVIKR